jgi:hypothetical protein
MSAKSNYKMRTNASAFRKGQVVTAEDIKATGADLKDWEAHGIVEKSDEERSADVNPAGVGGLPGTAPPKPGQYTDDANKAAVENAIREQAAAGGPLPLSEQDKIAGAQTEANRPEEGAASATPPEKAKKK